MLARRELLSPTLLGRPRLALGRLYSKSEITDGHHRDRARQRAGIKLDVRKDPQQGNFAVRSPWSSKKAKFLALKIIIETRHVVLSYMRQSTGHLDRDRVE